MTPKVSEIETGARYLMDADTGWNLLCCLDECDPECGMIHQCWLSPTCLRENQQLAINFNQ